MFIKIVSIHDTESVNVPKNTLGLYEVGMCYVNVSNHVV